MMMPGATRCLAVLVSLWGCHPVRAATPPLVLSDQPEYMLFGETINYALSGGSTDAPPDTFGRPPWTRTGKRQYVWHVKESEPEADGTVETDPADGKITTTNSFSLKIEKPGTWDISVTLQEEWQDSEEEPLKVFREVDAEPKMKDE